MGIIQYLYYTCTFHTQQYITTVQQHQQSITNKLLIISLIIQTINKFIIHS